MLDDMESDNMSIKKYKYVNYLFQNIHQSRIYMFDTRLIILDLVSLF